jgi:hypothetical protein
MESQALHELVNKVFGNEKTKAEFIANPDSVISRFSLTEMEKRAVLSTYAKLKLVTANSPQLEATVDPRSIWY